MFFYAVVCFTHRKTFSVWSVKSNVKSNVLNGIEHHRDVISTHVKDFMKSMLCKNYKANYDIILFIICFIIFTQYWFHKVFDVCAYNNIIIISTLKNNNAYRVPGNCGKLRVVRFGKLREFGGNKKLRGNAGNHGFWEAGNFDWILGSYKYSKNKARNKIDKLKLQTRN